MALPSTTASNGDRDTAGRFLPGNKAAKGNPYAQRIAQLRSRLLAAVTLQELTAVARSMIDKARKGDVAAARLVLEYTVGKPLPFSRPEEEKSPGGPSVFVFTGPAVVGPVAGDLEAPPVAGHLEAPAVGQAVQHDEAAALAAVASPVEGPDGQAVGGRSPEG